MSSSRSVSESEAAGLDAAQWWRTPWKAMADLAEAVDDLICSFDYMDTAMDNLVMLIFIWILFSIVLLGIAKWAYARFAKKVTEVDTKQKPNDDVPKKTTTEIISSADSVLATSAKVKSASFTSSKPPKPTGFVPATPPNKRRLGRMSPGPEQLTLKKHQSILIPTCTGPDQPSVQWVNDLLTWLYNDLVIVNELVQQWIVSMNEFSKKSVEEQGIGVELVRALDCHPPSITNVFCECDSKDDVTITCDCDATPAFQLKAFSQRGEKVEVSHYRVNVNRFRARLNVVCVTDKLTGELKCDGWPEVKVALAPVGALRPNATENNLQNAISDIVVSALRSTNLQFNLAQYPTCPRLRRYSEAQPPRLPLHYDSMLQQDRQLYTSTPNSTTGSGGLLGDKRLLVKVVGAKDIGGKTGCIAPYCVVEMDEPPQKNQTGFKKDTTSPQWEEHFLLLVYRLIAKRLNGNGELAAIKVIKLEPGDDFAIIQQEILMMKDCRHPNIVAYYGSYLRRDKLWISMEYCGGGSLQDIYHVTGPLTELQIAYMCRETLTGLSYLHSMGKMHRDIKGANILLTECGDVKLADFGVSAQITATINKRKSFIGTPYWMAPEVAAVERKGGYNQLCDIWACGITAIELAELQPPMFELHPMRVVVPNVQVWIQTPSTQGEGAMVGRVHSFLKLSLTKNPKKRPTADKLLQHAFFQQDMSKRLAIELLHKYSNPPTHCNTQEDDDGALSHVPQRIASRHTGRGGRRVPSDRDPPLPRTNPPSRPRSLLTERSIPPAPRPHSLLPSDGTNRRRDTVYDDSPIVDLDADDDLSVRSMPKVINFSADVNRTCDGDTVKRPVYHRQSSEDWSVASLMSCPKHNPLSQDLSTDTMPSSEKATLPLTADTASMAQASNSALSIHDQHLSQCIQLKQNFLNNSTTNIYQNMASNFQSPIGASLVSIDDPLCRKIGEDILYVDQQESEHIDTPQRNANCECGLCPKPELRDNNTLSDLQRSVAKCSCDVCNSNGDILSYYRNCSNQNTDSGIVICEHCKKQKISVSNFRALQIANRLRISEDDKLQNGGTSDDDLCRKIDISMNMEEKYEHRKKHNRHNSDSVTVGIDLNQFCQCELEVKRKTSSVDEIFKMVDENGRDVKTEAIDEESKTSQRQRSLSDSQRDKAKVDNKVVPVEGGTPPVPPRRSRSRRTHSPARAAPNGLPPTPKVHMGACFSKVFNGCPLRINCTASWIHPDTRDQHILIGAEEGIYTLNLNELHETAMDQLCPRRTIWLHVIKDVLMSLSGKTPSLYRHELLALIGSARGGRSLRVLPPRLLPRRFALTTRVPDTRGCIRCAVGRNPYNGYKYLCGATPAGLFLMQWYDPLRKFMLLKNIECVLPSPLLVFELIITPELEYPLLCVGATRKPMRLNLLNINSGATWFHSDELEVCVGGSNTVIPRPERLHTLRAVHQLNKDSVLVCHENVVDIIPVLPTTLDARWRDSDKRRGKLLNRIQFDFNIDSILCLADSVLAFHRHGVQGRSLRNAEITQEITDHSRSYRLLPHDKVVVLESHTLQNNTLTGEDGNDLYILAGHEASY